jgi:type VI protein secretion system component VasK
VEPVRGAFTKDGAKVVLAAINSMHFDDEVWVLGDDHKGQVLDKAAMQRGLMDQYTKDYIATWRGVLRKSNVIRYGGLKDAASRLSTLASSSSPLLKLFWWTSQNTCVDVPGVKDKFQAPQAVVPCGNSQFLIVDANRQYDGSLLSLQQAVDRAASDSSGNKEDSLRSMHDSASQATISANTLGSTFAEDDEGQINKRSLELLLQPIKNLDGQAPSDLKGAGESFCKSFLQATQRKFPFDAQSTSDASLEELGALLEPKKGRLWVFYESSLKSVLQCANGECSPMGGATLDPRFAPFIGNLMKFSRALYGESGSDMNYQYTLTPKQTDQVEEFEITVNGSTEKLKGGAQHGFVWPGSGTRNFGLSVKLNGGGAPLEMGRYEGLWGVFHFFNQANKNVGTSFTWSPTTGLDQQPVRSLGRPLTYDLSVSANGPVIFSKEFLSKLKCVVPVAH